MKARGTISGSALMKIVAIALISPSALMLAQHSLQTAQSPRPTYQPNQPVQSTPGSQNQKPAQNLRPGQGGDPTPSLYGNGTRRPDEVWPAVPPGHLADWLNQHRNLPPAQQEQLLLRDPYFLRLNPMDQRKVLNQLHRMETMNNEQLQRRLARAEAIERLSPQEKMQVNASAERMKMLPEDRRQMLIRAFRDLRAVPLGERDEVLSSAYYRTTFTPAERIILHDLLRVEPYEPVRP